MISRRIIAVLVTLALGLPIVILVLIGLRWLLASMGDYAWASVLFHINRASGLIWVLNLLCLVICLGVNACCEKPPPSPPREH